eukprot:108630_1
MEVIAIVFTCLVWIIGFCVYCFAPLHDDAPLISKSVVIPSQFRYKMFRHTKEGRINDILRHNYKINFRLCKRFCNLLCVYWDNSHICCSFYKRNIGSNIYQCDRLLFFIFHILCIAFLLQFITSNIFKDSILHYQFVFMFTITIITLFIVQLFTDCVSLSVPNRLHPQTIELLVKSETERIKSETVNVNEPNNWNQKRILAETDIQRIIHIDTKSNSLKTDVAKWSVDEVCIWIEAIGLPRYVSDFQEKHINGKELLRFKINDIKLIISLKKDIEFFDDRLTALKTKWKHRFITLRTNPLKSLHKDIIQKNKKKDINLHLVNMKMQRSRKSVFFGALTTIKTHNVFANTNALIPMTSPGITPAITTENENKESDPSINITIGKYKQNMTDHAHARYETDVEQMNIYVDLLKAQITKDILSEDQDEFIDLYSTREESNVVTNKFTFPTLSQMAKSNPVPSQPKQRDNKPFMTVPDTVSKMLKKSKSENKIRDLHVINTPKSMIEHSVNEVSNPDTHHLSINKSPVSVSSIYQTLSVREKSPFKRGDFVDLILRDENNLVVVGVIEAFNTSSKLADVLILTSKTHNKGNEIERFISCEDIQFKGFSINGLAQLRYNENDEEPIGFELDYEALLKEELFDKHIVEGWKNGKLYKPNCVELFDGLKVKINEVSPSGLIIVTILVSKKASKYLLDHTCLKMSIMHIVPLHAQRSEQLTAVNAFNEETVIRSNFYERRKIMMMHYKLHRRCRMVARIVMFSLCIFFSFVLIFPMYAIYEDSLYGSFRQSEWYWLLYVIFSILLCNSVTFLIYCGCLSFSLIFRQIIYDKYHFDLCRIQYIMCYYGNQRRLNVNNKIEKTELTGHSERNEYQNIAICVRIFCCYYRCFECCHYGLHQPPNAPHLLQFFDPVQ